MLWEEAIVIILTTDEIRLIAYILSIDINKKYNLTRNYNSPGDLYT